MGTESNEVVGTPREGAGEGEAKSDNNVDEGAPAEADE